MTNGVWLWKYVNTQMLKGPTLEQKQSFVLFMLQQEIYIATSIRSGNSF